MPKIPRFLVAILLVLLPFNAWADPPPRLLAKLNNTDYGTSCVLSPDGRQVCAYAWKRIDLWEVASGQVRKTINVAFPAISDVLFAPGAKSVVVAGRGNGAIEVYDLATGSLKKTLSGHRDSVFSLTMSPDGSTLASTERFDGGSVRLWNLRDAKEIGVLEPPSPNFVSVAMAFLRDGKTLIVGGYRSVNVEKKPGVLENTMYGEIHFWDLADKKLLRKIDIDGGGIGCMALSPKDDRLLLSTHYRANSFCSGLLASWDVKKNKWRPELPTDEGIGVNCLAFSPDERLLVVGGYVCGLQPIGAFAILNAATGKKLVSFDFPSQYKSSVVSVSFAADSRLLAVGGNHDGVRLYDVSAMAPPASLPECKSNARENGALAAAGADSVRRSPEEMRSLWDDLISENAGKAYQAICVLAKTPAQTNDFAAKHLLPVEPGDAKQIRAHVDSLSSSQLRAREKATQGLLGWGERAIPHLRNALAGAPTLETRRRMEQIIEKIDSQMPAETLRGLRAVEVLEWIGTPEAVLTLRKVANGLPEARVTQDACRSLQRLAQRP